MWWLLAIWLLANGKQPGVSGWSTAPRSHDNRGKAPRPKRPSKRGNVDITDTQPHRSEQSTLDTSKGLDPADYGPLQPGGQGYNPYQYNPYNAPYGMPETQPQSWQGDGGQGYGDAYADAYADWSEGEGEGESMVATPGHWERARAGETPDTPDGMIWVDDA